MKGIQTGFLAAAVVLGPAIRSPASTNILDSTQARIGMNAHFFHPGPGELEAMRKAGIDWIRRDVLWKDVEKQPGLHRFDGWIHMVDSLDRYGMRALFVLCYGNKHHTGGRPPRADAEVDAFARFAAAAATAFKGRGVVWEIWNEPNLGGFWPPEPEPDRYIALLRATSLAMRRADPDVVLLGPAQAGSDTLELAEWLRLGLLDHVDGISFHPYRGSRPETFLGDLAAYRRTIARAAGEDRRVPLVISEWGYSTFEGSGGVPEDLQARYLARSRLLAAAAGIPLSFWYDWQDDGDRPTEREHRYGTVRRGATFPLAEPHRKLAYVVDSVLSPLLRGARFVSMERPDSLVWKLTFARGDTTWSAIWRTKHGTHWIDAKGRCLSLLGGRCRTRRGSQGRQQVMIGPEPVYSLP